MQMQSYSINKNKIGLEYSDKSSDMSFKNTLLLSASSIFVCLR